MPTENLAKKLESIVAADRFISKIAQVTEEIGFGSRIPEGARDIIVIKDQGDCFQLGFKLTDNETGEEVVRQWSITENQAEKLQGIGLPFRDESKIIVG